MLYRSSKLIAALVLTLASSLAVAGTSTEDDVKAKIKTSNTKIKEACGCTLKFSIDPKWDMTNGDLLYTQYLERTLHRCSSHTFRRIQ